MKTITLMQMMVMQNYDPFDESHVLQFINQYWKLDYDIPHELLNQLKLLFVDTYMFYDISYIEGIEEANFSPVDQWCLMLRKFLRQEENWYLAMYDKLPADFDPLEFTKMVSTTKGGSSFDSTSKVDGTNTNNGTTNSDGNSTSNSKATGSSKNSGSNTQNVNGSHNNSNTSNSTNVGSSSSTDNGVSTSSDNTNNSNANGVGTLTGGGSPVSVNDGGRVVSDSSLGNTLSNGRTTNNSGGNTSSNDRNTGSGSDSGTNHQGSNGSQNSSGSTSGVTGGSGTSKSNVKVFGKNVNNSIAKNEGTTNNDSTTTVEGLTKTKTELMREFMRGYRNINKEFVGKASILFINIF